MFDTKIHEYKTEVVAVTKVVEKSITPDKVVEMYNKIEKEFLENVKNRYSLRSSFIDGECVHYVDHLTLTNKYTYFYSLNGEKRSMTVIAKDFYMGNGEIVEHFEKEIIRELKNFMLKNSFQVILNK